MNSKIKFFALILTAAIIFPLKSTAYQSISAPAENNNWIKIVDTKRKCLLKLEVTRHDKAINLNIQALQDLCFGNYTRVEFTLDDGNVFSAYGSNEDNCSGSLHLGFGGIFKHEQKMNELVRHTIKRMLIKDAENEIIFYLNEQQSKEIRDAFDKVMSKTYTSI
jgi:hypothetical protein